MALYHSVKGPVNYTVVGSPTIVDGVMTGDNGRIDINRSNNLWSQNSFEVVYALRFDDLSQVPDTTLVSLPQQKLDGSSSIAGGIYKYQNSISIYCGFTASGSLNAASLTVQNHIKYKVKISKDNNIGNISVSMNDEPFSVLGSYDISDTMGINEVVQISAKQGLSQILKEDYVIINGQPWFGLCPVEVQRHQLKGPVSYTVIGSPTIKDGIVSGFQGYPDSPSWVKINNYVDLQDNFEVCVAFTTGNSRNKGVLTSAYNSNGRIEFTYPYMDILEFNIKDYNNNSIVSFYTESSELTLQNNTKYILRITYNGTNYNFYIINPINREILWTHSETSSQQIGSCSFGFGGILSDTLYLPLDGSIDLNETYIKVNGKLWFYQPADTKYIVKDGKLVWADPHIYIDDNGTKTYATQHIAPVPARCTFGTTTTPSIGYVDMRTQQFTAAPQGATIGRDE